LSNAGAAVSTAQTDSTTANNAMSKRSASPAKAEFAQVDAALDALSGTAGAALRQTLSGQGDGAAVLNELSDRLKNLSQKAPTRRPSVHRRR